ncbi:galactose-3-O-sulfotransferase 2-like [Notolabrus celidotus]|uniref:galactose-3-O-sulfotransferase 2-like n=1 Tax=Notolabrus celidotus TaxID=1203425 RepID=UPI0014903F5E|nr:galactose-3-O-sulfotransferase 2-like [Notolabrus celidotus]
MWALLIFLIVCIIIQIFVTYQTGDSKLTGLQHLSVNKPQVFASLQNILESFSLQSLGGWAGLESLHENRTAYKTVRPDAGHHTEAGEVSPGGPPLPDPENKLSLGLSQRTSSAADQTLLHINAPSSTLKPGSTCSPKSHILFLKTHKTGSSTILNILYRYGESRNLTFALPVKRQMQLFYPNFFAERFVEGVKSQHVNGFHIMCNHMRFYKSEVAKVMPAETFYFSILRHPVAMMESLFSYYKSLLVFRKSLSLDDFLDSSLRNQTLSVSKNNYAHNNLAFDFGLENNVTADSNDLEERASAAIAAIERDFQLVLISEYFDESIILLKHSLCWSLEDMVFFKLNSRSEGSRQPLSTTTAEKIKRWNALDWRIYLHFNATFWHRVDSEIGREQMEGEVNALRALQAKQANICLRDGGAVHPSQVKDARMKPFQSGKAVIQGYNLNPLTDMQLQKKCLKLITPELQYTLLLQNKQFPDFHL